MTAPSIASIQNEKSFWAALDAYVRAYQAFEAASEEVDGGPKQFAFESATVALTAVIDAFTQQQIAARLAAGGAFEHK